MKLWQQRNETNVHVFQRATHLLEEWRAAQDIRSRSNNQNTIPHVRTTSLEEDRWKKLAPGSMVGLGMCLGMMVVHLFLQERNSLPLFAM
ncbi:transmembrane protein, putative [Medicago truncatula]|uniref:Transmembrane protein, putative n=1 Tax=Medicago truncatula TaxID=3880 RepID=A0A072UBH1_MEDTR|nr:transmembrane protein, putative [Medicago truncatula]